MSEEKNQQRLNDLESKLMYLQKDYDALNETVLENTRRLEQLTMEIARLNVQLRSQVDAAEQPRSLEDEKPPHY